MHRASGRRALGRSIAELESLFNLQIRQALNLQDATRKNIFLALLRNGEQAGADRVERNRVDQIAQRDARLQLALEADQHAFGHIQRHHTGGSSECDQA